MPVLFLVWLCFETPKNKDTRIDRFCSLKKFFEENIYTSNLNSVTTFYEGAFAYHMHRPQPYSSTRTSTKSYYSFFRSYYATKVDHLNNRKYWGEDLEKFQ